MPIGPITTFLIKDCLDIPRLPSLVNYSLSEGSFPDAFKKAVVIALTKKALLSGNEVKNYCPVSGLCFLSKLVELVAAKQLACHINSIKLDNPLQSACKL